MSRRENDTLITGPAVPALVLRLALVIVVALGSWPLIPVFGWQIVAIVAAVIAAVMPQSCAAWVSIGCLALGMAMSQPDIWRGMLAVLVVHLIQVLASLTLAIPPRARVLLAALLPSVRRLLVVQVIAQPLTLLVLLVVAPSGVGLSWAAPLGAVALLAVAVLLVLLVSRVERRS